MDTTSPNNKTAAHALVPMQSVGPVPIRGPEVEADLMVPLASYESPVWPSTQRGARVCARAGGIITLILDDRMTRSVIFEAPSVVGAAAAAQSLSDRLDELRDVASETTRFGRLVNLNTQIVGKLLYVRFEMTTGDASGHNMVTLAADRLMQWVLSEYADLRYVSISGNLCTDKKASAVNGLLGRGKNVVAEVTISRELCKKYLRTTPEALHALNIKKNLVGTSLAGGLRSANAHFANILLAFYLATGQDAANIIEGSQGYTYTDVVGDDLYFSVSIPNVIVGTVGNGKDLGFVEDNLKALGCREKREPGENARRLAIICGATVLCGELSLLAAQTNPGELMRAHKTLERKGS
jgi:hydroxymethylglutaryl-CoA reductase (NADPH)